MGTIEKAQAEYDKWAAEIISPDKEYDRMIEEKHEAEEKIRILNRVEEVVDLFYLTQKHPYDVIVEVYQLAFADGHEACKREELEWSDFER